MTNGEYNDSRKGCRFLVIPLAEDKPWIGIANICS